MLQEWKTVAQESKDLSVTLGSYEPAGEELERFHLRPSGEAPAAWAAEALQSQ